MAVAPFNVPFALVGETGTGKEVFCRAIHRWSLRAARPFVAFNCAAIPDLLLESELFGHVRGAFTGASTERRGLFEEADSGTIFLDEIGEMPLNLQSKLLRVLQDGEVRRVGSNRAIRVDVRVLSASGRDLATLVAQGRFRSDLMFRLNAVSIRLPPLRERRADVLLLAHHFLGLACRRAGKRIPGLAPQTLAVLMSHSFPGNVREFENEMNRAGVLTPEGEPVQPDVLSVSFEKEPDTDVPVATGPGLREMVEAFERRLVEEVLARSGRSVSAAARELGLTRTGFYKVMERLGIRAGTDVADLERQSDNSLISERE